MTEKLTETEKLLGLTQSELFHLYLQIIKQTERNKILDNETLKRRFFENWIVFSQKKSLKTAETLLISLQLKTYFLKTEIGFELKEKDNSISESAAK
jgi:ABC-type uncharacterized transport system permease subunit